MTGDQFVNLVLKRLLGVVSIREQFLEYLQAQIVDFTAKVYDLNGTYGDTKVAFGIATANEFDLTADLEGTDGSGHLLKIGSTYEQNVKFANESAIDYYVGLKYVERPHGVGINPRSGYPEYESWGEVIGERGEPDSVSDEGGYLRFTINTVAGGVNEWVTGRKALVWKKAPAAGATTEAIAIQLCDCSDIGGVPTGSAVCDSADYFGQTTPSTTASDYEVILLGPRVSRYTDLSATAGYWFIGTVTGGGTGNPPSGSDNSGQRLIEHSLSDVLAYGGGSNWYDGTTNPATTIEAQLDKIITDLIKDTGTGGPNASGAHKLGAAAQSGSPESLAVGSIGAQLLQLLTWINTKGHIEVANTWTAQQLFQASGSTPPLRVAPKTTAFAQDGEHGVDNAATHFAGVRVNGNVRKYAEAKQTARVFLYPITCGYADGRIAVISNPPTGVPMRWVWSETDHRWEGFNYTGGGEPQNDPIYLFFSLNRFLHHGVILKQVRVSWDPGGSRTGTDRLRMTIKRASRVGIIQTDIGQAYCTDSSTSKHDTTIGSLTHAMDTEAYSYWIEIRAGVGSADSARDYVYSLEFTYEEDAYMHRP